jgi:hypothetical protein
MMALAVLEMLVVGDSRDRRASVEVWLKFLLSF